MGIEYNGDINRLLTQFNDAKGFTFDDITNPDYYRELAIWINQMNNTAHRYLDALQDQTLFGEHQTYEIDKSFLDAITLDYDTTIISLFKDKFPPKFKDRVYQGEFRLSEGQPNYLIREDLVSLINLPKDGIYMINNPHTLSYSRDIQIMDENNINYIYGMFGSFEDNDATRKIDELGKLKSILASDPTVNIQASGNDYFAYIASNAIVRKREKKE